MPPRLRKNLKKQGVRAITDLRNEKIGLKNREHTLQRVPYLIVVGDKEVAANQLAVRTRGGKDLGAMSVETFNERLQVELSSHGRRTLEIDASLLHPSASGATTRSLRPVCG